MSRDPRDWQKDMDMCNAFGDSVMPYSLTEFSRMLPYWLQEAKTLKEDNARWICQWNGAEQKYLTQSNVIAELRERAVKAEKMEDEWKDAYWSLHAKYLAINPLDREDTPMINKEKLIEYGFAEEDTTNES